MPQEVVLDLGIKRELTEQAICQRFLPRRQKISHKGDYGTLLLAAGSFDMPGAPVLAAKAAFTSGCGRIQAALPYACRGDFASHVKEATFISLSDDNKDFLNVSAAQGIKDIAADALVLGMGIGRRKESMEAVKAILATVKMPCVVDADALFALQHEKDFVKNLKNTVIFTPHEGEFARLCGKSVEQIHENRISAAQAFAAEWRVILVLKGPCTIIATPDGRMFFNPTGNPGMATAGSGDVLSGIIGSLLAQKLPPVSAAAVGVYLHGAAGDKAAAETGEYSLTAGDIIKYLPQTIKEIVKC